MNKEEQSQNLYQQLLKRNQINADIIRKFIKKSKQYKTIQQLQHTKQHISQHDYHLTHTKNTTSLQLQCTTRGNQQMSFKNNSKQLNSNIYHQLSQNNSEKINKVNSRFPLINSLHSTNKIHKQHTTRKQACISHSYLQKQTIKNCQVSQPNYTHNDNQHQHDHQIESNIIKINQTSQIGNQKHEIANQIEDKRASKDLKQIVNMKQLKFEVPNSQQKCKQNSKMKSKDRNKPKQSNNLLSYSFQNKKNQYPGFYANSQSGIFDTLDSIANMFDSTQNTHKLNISREASNQQKAISSISFSAISYLIGNAGKLGINSLEQKGIDGERFFRNWRQKHGLQQLNKSSIMQIGDLLNLYPTKLSGTQNKRISQKTNILMANINKLKEFKLNFHKMAKQQKEHNLIPKTQVYRNISSNSVSLPMTNSMHENEKGKQINEIKFKNIGHIFNKI